MWRYLRCKNFKSLHDVRFNFERLTVLVGPNAAGKTSVLEACRMLADLAHSRGHADPVEYIRERFSSGLFTPAALKTRNVGADEFIELQAVVEPGAWNQRHDDILLRMRPAWKDAADQTPLIEIEHNGEGGRLMPHAISTGQEAATDVSCLGHGPALQLSLQAAALSKPSYVTDENAQMQADGYGLASMLAALAATDRSRIDQLEETLRKIVPRALRVRTPRAKIRVAENQVLTVSGRDVAVPSEREVIGNRLEVEMEGAGWLEASLLSEGTLITIGVLCLLYSETCPKLLLIDDLDHSLHPRAYGKLVKSLRVLLEERPELQIVCTTHAPYLLDCFAPEEVRVLSVDKSGHTRARALTEHPEWSDRLRGGLSSGEFWSSVGEDWVSAVSED
jgi:hypothetical protein